MSSSRSADAAHVTPYPPGISPGRGANAVPEGSEPSRQHSRSRKGPKPRARVDRSSRPEEERFNVGPINPRNTSGARSSRRQTRNGRHDRSVFPDLNDGVPNYPPPSFQEAISTPGLSICPSTLTLVSTVASPTGTFLPHNVPSIPQPSVATSRWTPIDTTEVNNTDPESNSDSDDSLQIIDSGSVPPDHGLPTGSDLDTRVREDWRHRRGVEFPSPNGGTLGDPLQRASERPETRGRSQQRPAPLDLAAILDGPETPRSPTISSPKRRFLSLSPLRTIFPSKTPHAGDRPQTAHPTPGTSPYLQSPKGSTFFRSTTSLATTSFLRLPLTTSSHSNKSEKRRFFSSKKKAEALDAWEELSVDDAAGLEETPTSLMSVVESACSGGSPSPITSTSPTRSLSFTYGAQMADAFRSMHASIPAVTASQPLPKPAPAAPAPPPAPPRKEHQVPDIHPLSLLDRKTPFIQRPVRRNPAPTPPRIQVPIPVPLEPVLTTVRTRLPQNQRSATPPPPLAVPPQPVLPRNIAVTQVTRPSPLSQETFSPPEIAAASTDPSFWKAVETPLPSTPLLSSLSFATSNSSPTTPNAVVPPATQQAVALRGPQPARADHSSVECGVSNKKERPPPLLEQPPIFSRTPSPFVEEPVTPTRHHYPGRPLPRLPAYPRAHIDSTFAPNEEFESSFIPGLSSCPEGLLIDLDDSNDDQTSDDTEAEDISTAFTDDLVDLSPASESTVTANICCPTPLSATLESLTFMPTSSSTPPPQIRVDSDSPGTNASGYSDFTDLDLLVSHLTSDEQRLRDGTHYDVSSSSVPPSPKLKGAHGGVGETDGGVIRRKHQTLSALPIEGSTLGSGIRWPREPSPSRISWRKPISPDLSPRGSEHGGGGGGNGNPSSIVGHVPSRVIHDNHPRQLQWQYFPARVY